jgi:two-component system sensor histidine kinase KdpD
MRADKSSVPARRRGARRDDWLSTLSTQFILSTLVLFSVTSLAMIAKPWLGEGYAALIFVVGIMLIGTIAGFARALATAVVGAAAFNFFVADPVWQFRFRSGTDLLPPLVFLLCAVVSGTLSGRLRDESIRAALANARLHSLLAVSRDLQQAREPADVWHVLLAQLRDLDTLKVRLYALGSGGLQPFGGQDPGEAWDITGHAPGGHTAGPSAAMALRSEGLSDGKTTLGALVYQPGRTTVEDIAFIAAMAQLGSLALNRLRFDAEAAHSRVLARSEELKTALLSSVSHDFRTPLTTISTAASSLLTFGATIDGQTRDELLTHIVEECSRLNHLTENLLQLSRLQAGAHSLRQNMLSAQDMIRRCVARLRAQAEHHRFVIAVPDDEVMVMVDPALFELALINILQNAVKFSAPGSTITARCDVADNACLIAVTDEGSGIAPEAQEKVFERFYRAHGGASAPGGSGLGLAIAKGFVEASGGAIALASPIRDGRGTIVTIRLPRAVEDQLP